MAKDPSRFLPLNALLDSRALLRFQRSVPEDRQGRLDASDEMALAFRQYKIPLITLNNASLEVVTKSFQRVNSRGTVMSELHMINALTYSESFDLLAEERKLRDAYLSAVGWENIEQDVILRALKLRLGVDLYTPKPEAMSAKLKAEPEALKEVILGLSRVAAFFKSEFGLEAPDLFPYQMQLIALASVASRREIFELHLRLRDWLILTSYSEAFGSSARQTVIAISDLEHLVNNGEMRWSLRQKPSVRSLAGRTIDFRSARGKLTAMALSEAQGESARGILNKHKKDAFCRLSIAPGASGMGRVGSRVLIQPSQLSGFNEALLRGGMDADTRAAHLLSDEAMSSLAHGDAPAFLSLRERAIFDFERTIYGPASSRLLGYEIMEDHEANPI
jgi:hypothetical protein